MTEKTRVFWYLRVSSEEQALHGNWLNWQRWAIEDYADRNNLDIVKFYEDWWVSWKYESRKALDQMLRDLKKVNRNPDFPEIKYVVVDDIDRLARDIAVWIKKREEIRSTWAKILSLKQDLKDNPESNLMSTISMATKQYERENNARRVRSRQEQRLKDGYRCFVVPLGYKYDKAKDGHGKVVVPDEPAFTAVSQWLKLLASWVIANQQSLCNYLNDRWIQSKKWWRIQKSLITRLLHPDVLRFYAWFLDYPKRWIKDIRWKHEPAISESEYYQITNTHQTKWFYKEYEKDEITKNLPLRSVLCCECCWRRLSWSSTKGNGWRYFYYYCWSLKCPNYRKSFKCDVVHHDIETLLKSMTLDDAYLNWIQAIFDILISQRDVLINRQLSDIKAQLSTIENKMDDLIDKIAESNSSLVTQKLEERIEELEKEKDLLMWEIAKKESWENDSFAEFEQLRDIIKSPYTIRNMWDIELKKLLINVLFWWTMTYSREHSTQTKEIPLIYAENLRLNFFENFWLKKSTQTMCTSVLKPINYVIKPDTAVMVGDIGLEPMTPCL